MVRHKAGPFCLLCNLPDIKIQGIRKWPGKVIAMTIDYSKRSFYEIYPTSYFDSNGDGIGDLNGISQKLEYIKSLGFTGLWLNPIFKSPFRDGGYDISDPFAVDPRFGTLEDLKAMLAKAHSLGFAVLFDLVGGHLSWDSYYFKRSAEPTPNEYSDLFIWSDNPWMMDDKLRMVRGLYDRNGTFLANFFVHQPALNYGFLHPQYSWEEPIDGKGPTKAKKFLVKIIDYWLSQGFDGFRADMAGWMVKQDDEDATGTIAMWKDVFGQVRKDYPDCVAVSEWSCPWQSLKSGFDSDFVLYWSENFTHAFLRNGKGLKGQHTFFGDGTPLFHTWDKALFDQWKGDFAKRFDASKDDGKWLSLISGNHDTSRLADWLTEQELKLAYLVGFLLPNVPFMYAGDEIGQTTYFGLPSKDGGYARTGTRTPMKWDHGVDNGFSTAPEDKLYLPINPNDKTVSDLEDDKDSLLNAIAKINYIRNTDADLTGNHDLSFDDSYPISFKRRKTLVVANITDRIEKVKVGKGQLLLTFGPVEVDDGLLVVPPKSGLVYRED